MLYLQLSDVGLSLLDELQVLVCDGHFLYLCGSLSPIILAVGLKQNTTTHSLKQTNTLKKVQLHHRTGSLACALLRTSANLCHVLPSDETKLYIKKPCSWGGSVQAKIMSTKTTPVILEGPRVISLLAVCDGLD